MIIQSSDPIVHITYGDIPSQMSNDTDDNHRYLWLFHTYFFIFKAVLQIVQGSPTLTILKKKNLSHFQIIFHNTVVKATSDLCKFVFLYFLC